MDRPRHPAGMAERTAWRICRDKGWWSVFGKRRGRGKNVKEGPPVLDDRVRRDFTTAPACGHALPEPQPRVPRVVGVDE
jgi:hypothetical protein